MLSSVLKQNAIHCKFCAKIDMADVSNDGRNIWRTNFNNKLNEN